MAEENHTYGYKELVAEFQALGDEPCSECGYTLNEIRDYVHELLALRKVVELAKPFTRACFAPNISGEMVELAKAIKEAEEARPSPEHKGTSE